ncbi:MULTISPECIES: DUF6746 family protein [Gammaproteobacteria]|uniref:DUF6746 family protein n=1 Tax=Gammaproteobacteria TaxID=1236 RepID=UPI001A9F8198|nr:MULTISPECIES: DUF6746 family protein [Gammaproteobacteria]
MNFLKAIGSLALASVVASGVAGVVHASEDERYDHFEGSESPTIEAALANLVEYNQKLQEAMEGGLTPQEMADIHQMTYTLENALKRLDEELEATAASLEEVHLASETMQGEIVSEQGRAYLEKVQKIFFSQN